jgi:hypothetical protein
MLPQGQQFRSESQRRSFSEGQAKTILAVLEARGLAISDEQRARVLAATDAAVFDRWARRAVTIKTTDELFAD